MSRLCRWIRPCDLPDLLDGFVGVVQRTRLRAEVEVAVAIAAEVVVVVYDDARIEELDDRRSLDLDSGCDHCTVEDRDVHGVAPVREVHRAVALRRGLAP